MPEFNDYFPTSLYGSETINAKGMGCVGDGLTDDTAELQLCFDALRTPEAGGSGARGLYIPPGLYRTTNPIYVYNTTGVRIFGDGANSTNIQYYGPANAGNTIGSSTPIGGTVVPNQITPVLMICGLSYSTVSGVSFQNMCATGDPTNAVAVFIHQDTGFTAPVHGNTTTNTWTNVNVSGLSAAGPAAAKTGFLIGSDALCSEQTFINCHGTYFTGYAWSVFMANALNINLYNCGGIYNNVWARCAVGQMNVFGASLAANTIDIEPGNTPMVIQGVRTESPRFVSMQGTQGYVTISACQQIGDAAMAGYFVHLGGSGSRVTMDCCQLSGPGIQGDNGAVFARGCYIASHTRFVEDLQPTSRIMEWLDNDRATTVAALPPPAAYFKGLKLYVTDANATTFNSIVAGGGSTTVPVFCDGTNWRIG